MQKPSELIHAIMQDVAGGTPVLEYGKIVRTGWEGDDRFIYSLYADGVVAHQKVVFSLVGEKAGKTPWKKDAYYAWEHTFGVQVKPDQELLHDIIIANSARPFAQQLPHHIELPAVQDALRRKNGASFSIDNTLAVLYHFNERKAEQKIPFIVPKQPLLQLLKQEETEFLLTKDPKHFSTYLIHAPFLNIRGPNDEGGTASLYQQEYIPTLAFSSNQEDCADIKSRLRATERLLSALEKHAIRDHTSQ